MIPTVEERADELKRLCLTYAVRRLDLFGSASTGMYDPDESDLDFLVEFQPAALNAYADAYFGLLEALGRLFGRPVDLVVESAIKTPTSSSRWSRRGLPSMKLEARKYLYDVQRGAGLLREFTDGKTFADYEGDAMLRSAVERQFEVIGEAMAQLARTDESLADRISQYQRIVAFRNVLIHGYADVDDRLVWDVINNNLPTLIREVEALLGESLD